MPARQVVRALWSFVWVQVQSLVFALSLFAMIAFTAVVELPVPRYDALLAAGIVLTLVLWWGGWESTREVGVITAFHILGLVMEIFKVHHGSWSYPDEGVTVVLGVPLYSGFMYAAVGSYICQAWRRFNLRVTGYRPVAMTILAVATYVNFFTHHWWWDVRWLLVVAFLVEMRRTVISFTVKGKRYAMPLPIAFVLVGFFLWVAENLGTLLGAWQYPNQAQIWELVHVGKLGSWALLVTLSFALIATVKLAEGRLYGSPGTSPTVQREPNEHAD